MSSTETAPLQVGKPSHSECTAFNHYFDAGTVTLFGPGKRCFCGHMAVHLAVQGLVVESPGFRGFIPLVDTDG